MIGLRNRTVWPKISIVTPVRNSGDTLLQTVHSIVTQEYPNLEYVVIDGGSSDNSLDIIYDWARHIDAFLSGKDRNLYDALAKAFAVCHGEILGWLNADDMYEPGILSRVGRIFAHHPDWDVVYFDGTVWKQGWRVPNRNQRPVGLPELMDGHILYQDSVFFRRRAYEAVGGVDRIRFRLAGDYDLWIRLAERFRFHYIPETASCFRIRPGQLSGDWKAYMQEMDLARSEARRRQASIPPVAPGRNLLAVGRRKRLGKRIDARRRFNYPLSHEELDWPPIVEQPLPPLSRCRCVVCDTIPDRLLFSTPDTWYGDRRLWNIYYCSRCAISILFPPPVPGAYGRRSELAMDSDGSLPAGKSYYKLFAGPRLFEGNPFYTRAARRLRGLLDRVSDLPRISEPRDSAILEIGCGNGEVLKHLAAAGYRNVTGIESDCGLSEALIRDGYRVLSTDFLSACLPEAPFDAAILHLTLENLNDPVGVLGRLSACLRRGGRVYIVTPNLDSIWLERYGPVWSQWHAPFRRYLFSSRGLRKLADKAGFRVRSLRSCSPPQWLYHTDLLSNAGLGGTAPPPEGRFDAARWEQVQGASILSALRWDWKLRGDCLHAVFVSR